jgi:hypothetical protein
VAEFVPTGAITPIGNEVMPTDLQLLTLLVIANRKLAEISQRLDVLQGELDKPEPPRCPRCGSYSWTYQADRQVCSDCGK